MLVSLFCSHFLVSFQTCVSQATNKPTEPTTTIEIHGVPKVFYK